MAGDELYDPLKKPAPAASKFIGRIVSVVILAGLCGAILAFAIAVRNDGSRGEPFAVATIEHAGPPVATAPPRGAASDASVATGSTSAGLPPGTPPSAGSAPPERQAGQEVEIENGVKVVRPVSATGPGSIVLKVPQPEAAGLVPAPDARLVETGPFGPLPKIGADGSRPADVYAGRSEPAGGKPRIAILLGGMGLDPAVTAQAGHSLPPAITFGFAPYGDNLDMQVRQAREAGHEVILLLPMEDFGKDEASLPHQLLAGPGNNKDRLHWLMGRFTGYAGVGNYLGGRLLGDEAALQPILREIAARGLYFADDGRTPRSLAGAIGPDLGLPVVSADVVIDAKPDPASITEALARLEGLARQRGFALGTATGLPGTNALVARFAASSQARGFVIVPASEVATAAGGSSARSEVPPRTR